MAYTNKADVKVYLGIPSATTSDDDLIDDFIASAQAWIDAHAGRTFEAAADSTRTMDAEADVDGPLLYLDGDLCSITSVTNGDGVTVTSSQYVTEPRRKTPYYAIRLLPSSGVSWTYTTDHEGAISVVGKWAYSETAPTTKVQLCIRIVAWRYRQKDNRNADQDRAVIAGNATILPANIPGDIRHMLNLYRRVT